MIEGFVGLPGAGKTYYVVKKALQALKKGVKVYSNFEIELDPTHKAELYADLQATMRNVYVNVMKDRDQWIKAGHDKHDFWPRPVIIVVDEIGILCPARYWDSFSQNLRYYFKQTRKIGINLWWTTQAFDDVDKSIRQITDFVWNIRKLPFKFRLGRCYETAEFGKAKASILDTVWFRLKKDVWYFYDTLTCIVPNESSSFSKFERQKADKTFYKQNFKDRSYWANRENAYKKKDISPDKMKDALNEIDKKVEKVTEDNLKLFDDEIPIE